MSVTAACRSEPSGTQIVQTPSSAVNNEIIGPAGSAMQMLPPIVAAFQILNEPYSDRQHRVTSGPARQSFSNEKPSSCASVQVAETCSPFSVAAIGTQPKLARSIKRRS